jgi:carbonic anhydrase
MYETTLSGMSNFDDLELQGTAVTDPAATVVRDVHRILESPVVSKQIAVSGCSYDVNSGRLTEVVASTRAGAR